MGASTKQDVIRIIQGMPDDASLEDIMYELYFRERVDRGLEEIRQDQTISHEEVMRSLAEWLQSAESLK